MDIYILNKTSTYTNNDISNLVSKIQQSEFLKQFCKDWNINIPKLHYMVIGWPVNPNNINISIFDNNINRKSYHSVKNDIPFANIFCDTKKNNLSALLTHELFELLINPKMQETFNFKNQIYLKEVCDPVSNNYFLDDNLKITDWILPIWFNENNLLNGQQINHLNTLQKTFELSEGGYMEKYII
jgi:hypothetical protein